MWSRLAIVLMAVTIGSGCSTSSRAQSGTSVVADLHRDAIVVDGHVHITNRVFWEGIDPWTPQQTGLWDYARAKQGGLDVVFEHVYIEDGFNDYNAAVKQAVRLVETFHRVLDANRDKMELALTSADARRIVESGKMAVVLVLEGGFDMEGDLDILRLFHRLGVRMIQFVNHNTTNAYADAYADEAKWNGITEQGRRVVHEMNRLGIIIDVSHASEAAQQQIIAASRAPVASSHQSQQRFSNHLQNLSDHTLRALAAKGGVSGIHGNGAFLSQRYYDWSRARQSARTPLQTLYRSSEKDYGKYMSALDAEMRGRWVQNYVRPWKELAPADAPLPSVDDWATQVDYAARLVGPDHVALGLDLMHGASWMRDFDATSYRRVTEALIANGHTPAVIRKILGENWLRLLDAARVVDVPTALTH